MLKNILGKVAQALGVQPAVNRCLKKLNYNRKTCINGVKMILPSIRGITCRPAEAWMTELLDKVFKMQSGTFIDVGVNLGDTLIKAKAVDPTRDYIGFEPNPVCISYVQTLIKENGLVNCTLLPVGLFTDDSVLAMDQYSDDASDSSATLIENFRPNSKIYSRVFVPVFRFDSLAALLGGKPAGVIKIDVEGAELEVVKSMLNLIRRDKPIILIEVLPVYSEDNVFRKNRQNELEQIFSDAGYAMLRVLQTNAGTFSGLKRIEKIGVHSDLEQSDYVVVPTEQLARLQMVLGKDINTDCQA